MENVEFEKLRLMKKIEKVGDCWIFTGALNNKKQGIGYGVTTYNRKRILAHRLSYNLFKGQIAKGLCVCHTCDNRKCCNPDHLWLGTHTENIKDAFKKGRLAPIWGRKKTQEEKDKIQRNRSIPDQKGEKHHNSKLKNDQVIEIRKLLNKKVKYREISEKFGIDICSIPDIKFRRTWKHI